jgi:hypothetical protein
LRELADRLLSPRTTRLRPSSQPRRWLGEHAAWDDPVRGLAGDGGDLVEVVQDLHDLLIAGLVALLPDWGITTRQLTIEITERMLTTDERRRSSGT